MDAHELMASELLYRAALPYHIGQHVCLAHWQGFVAIYPVAVTCNISCSGYLQHIM